MLLYKTANQRESDAKPSLGVGLGTSHLREQVEDMGLHGGWYADAGVSDANNNVIAAMLPLEEYSSAGLSVFSGIRKEIAENLLQSIGIGLYFDGLVWIGDDEPVSTFVHFHLRRASGFPQNVLQVQPHFPEFEAPLTDPRQIEHILH